MAQLPSLKRILSESFPEVKWIGRLLAPLNQFIEEIVRALNNELTIAANMDGIVKTVMVDGTFPVKFLWPRANPPKTVWIGACREVSTAHTTRGGHLGFTSTTSAGGAATEALTVTGLAATDTIVAVTQRTKGANNLPLLGWTTQAANSITAVWSADPGAGAVVDVFVLRGQGAIDIDWEYTGDGQIKINSIPGLTASASAKFNVTIIALAG